MDHSEHEEDTPKPRLKVWDPEEAVRALRDEADHFDETPESLGKRLLEEALPTAIASLAHLSMNASNENTRLKASQYIVDRNLGTPQSGGSAGKEAGVMDEFIKGLEVFANGGD